MAADVAGSLETQPTSVSGLTQHVLLRYTDSAVHPSSADVTGDLIFDIDARFQAIRGSFSWNNCDGSVHSRRDHFWETSKGL